MSLFLQLTMDATLPNDLTALHELVSTLRGALDATKSEYQQTLAVLQAENKLLRQKLELFLSRYFGGTKNESLDPNSNCCWPASRR